MEEVKAVRGWHPALGDRVGRIQQKPFPVCHLIRRFCDPIMSHSLAGAILHSPGSAVWCSCQPGNILCLLSPDILLHLCDFASLGLLFSPGEGHHINFHPRFHFLGKLGCDVNEERKDGLW